MARHVRPRRSGSSNLPAWIAALAFVAAIVGGATSLTGTIDERCYDRMVVRVWGC